MGARLFFKRKISGNNLNVKKLLSVEFLGREGKHTCMPFLEIKDTTYTFAIKMISLLLSLLIFFPIANLNKTKACHMTILDVRFIENVLVWD